MIFKCRASGAGHIMTDPKGKEVINYKKDSIPINTASFNKLLLSGKLDGVTGEIEKIPAEDLSDTCKTYVRNQWVVDTYHRDREFSTSAIQKGLANEETGITMLSLYLGEMLEKNTRHYENEYLKGTPDVPESDIVYDIKCSWDIFTFAAAGPNKIYDWQTRSYMQLLGLKKGAVVYVLTNTPEKIIHQEVRTILWKVGEKSEPGEARYEEIYRGIKKELTFDDIPTKDRIKFFYNTHEDEKIDQLYKRVEKCREYYNTLTL